VKLQAILLLAYGFANALLYSALLPLWEGFDEPFHFGYVQYLANGQGLPDPRTSSLSREIATSLTIAPASGLVRVNLPEIKTTFSEYFSLTAIQRAAIHDQLRAIPTEWRLEGSHFGNYEAQQAPLAYVLPALPERVLAGVPLPTRVLALRIVESSAGMLLLYWGALGLLEEFRLGDSYKSAAIFCIFSSQMTWATLAHVANDWLAVPLAVWLLTLTIRYWRDPNLRSAIWVGVVLALGLLTKAYFLAFTGRHHRGGCRTLVHPKCPAIWHINRVAGIACGYRTIRGDARCACVPLAGGLLGEHPRSTVDRE
jgi:hypothetical protein